MRGPADVDACPSCGTPTPQWHERNPAPRNVLWRRLALVALVLVGIGLLLPPEVGATPDVLVLAGSVVLVIYALRIVRGPT